jgi:signal transduction histidine kinase
MPGKQKTSLPDINRFLSELNESFSIITDLEQLKDNFSARLKELFGTDNILIFLLHPDLNRFLPVNTLTENSRNSAVPYILPTDRMIFWLSVNKTFLDLQNNREVYLFLSDRERELLAGFNTGLIYPFIVMNQVKGLVFIGSDMPHPMLAKSLHQMKVLMDQAGFAFENAYHYTLQKERTRKMYRADRLATLGELAAGAAHEIRNPLTSIRSSIQYLKRKLEQPADLEMADDLIDEVDRINDIIEGMLSFAKPVEPRKEAVNFRSLLTQVLQLVSNMTRKKDISIEMVFNPLTEQIVADPDQLKQVFINVIINSVQSIEHQNGLIRIEVNESYGQASYNGSLRNYIIEISDNGKGIGPENIERIFDPFFTTKSEGTGLGLSISYGIISRHGGDIELSSELQKGTKVKIKLPA